MISALAWVPKGAAKEVQEIAEYTAEELALAKLAAEGDRLFGLVHVLSA